MSSPLIWIFIPAVISLLLYAFRRWNRASAFVCASVALLLAWLAWNVPISQPIPLGPWPGLPAVKIDDTFEFFGRKLLLEDSARPVLALIYFSLAVASLGARTAGADRLFFFSGMAIAPLITATLAVEPFLYATLLLEMAALACVPILSPPGKPVSRGVLRFLSTMTLGTPFILLTGWFLMNLEKNPSSSVLLAQTFIFLGLGFAFLSAVFPFSTWIPMVAEEAHPYTTALVFYLLSSGVFMFGITFLQRYTWLRSSAPIYTALLWMGILMLVIGSLWSLFQQHLGRMMGYAFIMEIGWSLLALTMNPLLGADMLLSELFFAELLPRGLSLAVWSLAVSILQTAAGSPNLHSMKGIARRYPVTSTALFLSWFSLAGAPLLAGFPVRLPLWLALAQTSPQLTLLSLLASGCLAISGLRALAVFVQAPIEENWRISENRQQGLLLIAGSAFILLVGIMPQWFLPAMAKIALAFAVPGQ